MKIVGECQQNILLTPENNNRQDDQEIGGAGDPPASDYQITSYRPWECQHSRNCIVQALKHGKVTGRITAY